MVRKTLLLSSVIVAAAFGLLALKAVSGSPIWPEHRLREIWVLHLSAMAFTGLAMGLCLPQFVKSAPISFLAFVIGFTAALPIVGLFFILCFRLLFRLNPDQANEVDYYFGDRQVLTPAKRVSSTTEVPLSVMEILSGEDKEARRRAILALRSVEPKKSLPVLQKAIQDSDEQVRLLAQTQFNRIIAGLELAVKSIESELAGPAPKTERLVQLAEEYHELVYLGLSSDETQIIYLDRAVELLREAVRINPDNQEAHLLLLKCYLKTTRLAEARQCLAELARNGAPPETLAPWESEIYFLEHNWAELAKSLQRIQEHKNTDLRLAHQIDFWLRPPAKV
jgi:tetratricopeptide (TPR) repeat protein